MAISTRRAATDAADSANGPPRPRFVREPGRSVRASGLGVDFETFAAALRRALVPASPLEDVLTDRLTLAAWRLQLASAVEFNLALIGDDLPPVSRETLAAEESLELALELLETSRTARLGRGLRPDPVVVAEVDDVPEDALMEADYSNEWTPLPAVDDHDSPDEDEDDHDDAAPVPRWQDRLVFDHGVSEISPVVKGTWVTVSHVVSLIVDGWTWSDVLRAHPELTEDDIRTCLAYTVEQDNRGEF